ncbi:hypothetical protein [Gramella sp. MAR_2010_147]|uniref:hypothetical protein n=1 Tax=Gramella sp. MAR_2010_147 TaxID=1250205 RepID=UPI00087BED99|nr:hypothetical protein [Gramella sp. MAR_2010_147]SDS05499.1 hypothetical protein SAMN04488553_1361 [Gramella sp. MAR_2010_147]
MKYKRLGDHMEIPKINGSPLREKEKIKFNYYLSSRMNGKLVDVDITSKLFDGNKMYIRKSCYRIPLGDVENCVKENTIEHMLSLGLKETNIPDSLKGIHIKDRKPKFSNKSAFSD